MGGHVAVLARNDWNVFATYTSQTAKYTKVTFLHLDLEDEESIHSVMNQVHPHAVIHCAAWSNIDSCEVQPERAFRVNTGGTEILAKHCNGSQCRLVFTSSDMVFDGQDGCYSEKDQTNPINVYGETKVAAEKAIRSACPDSVIARVALVYGQSKISGNSFSKKILDSASRGKVVRLFTDQIRTPILVDDLARALLELADHDFCGTIHLGGAEGVNRYQLGLRLAELKNISRDLLQPVTMADVQSKGPRPRDVSFDIGLARRVLKTRLLGYYEGLERA